MLLWLIVIPLLTALCCLALPFSALRRASMVAGAAVHFVLVMRLWRHPAASAFSGFLALDPLGQLMLTLISLLLLGFPGA